MKSNAINSSKLGRAAVNLAAAQGNFSKGLELHQKGHLVQAQELYRLALKFDPRHFDALHFLGVISAQTGNFDQALALIDKAIQIDSNNAVVWNNRGNTLRALNRPQAAIDSYEKAIALKGDYPVAYYNRGNVLRDLEKLQAAVESYSKAITLKADYAEAYNSLGKTLMDLGQPEAAKAHYEKAIAINANYAEAHNNLGNALRRLMQPLAAIASHDTAIGINVDYAEAYADRGGALSDLSLYHEAVASYDKAIALRDNYANAHLNQSLCLLRLGSFELGWRKYESRWEDSAKAFKRNFHQPLWLGEESLQGKTILLHGEQGLGDTLQFCRYAKLVRDLGARVILEVQNPLVELLANHDGVTELVTRGGVLPTFDYHCPLLSLPLAFKTNLGNIPGSQGYLAARSDKVALWQARLGEQRMPRVGLVWSGYTGHQNDQHRSFLLRDLLASMPSDLQYISLQKEPRSIDKETLEQCPEILHVGEEIADFNDTAALCALVDVVVSADTSVAHLAGALGKPVWILLPFNADWRWLVGRSDSPWYASAKLYRQETFGDWSGAFRAVGASLSTFSSRGIGDLPL